VQRLFQAVGDFEMSAIPGQADRRVALVVSLIWPGTRPQQNIDESDVPMKCRTVKGGRTSEIRRMDIGSAIEQGRHAHGSVAEHGKMQWRETLVPGLGLEIGASQMKEANDLPPFRTFTRQARNCDVQRGEATQKRPAIDIRLVL
jgi:hypothetical protein